MINKKYWTNITAGAVFTALVVSASAADPQLLLDFQFNEGQGYTSDSSVGSTVLYWYNYDEVPWSTSTPARDADPALTDDFSVYVDNKDKSVFQCGIFEPDTIDFGDTSDPSFTLEAWFKGLSKSSSDKQVFFNTWFNTTGKCPRLSFAIKDDFTVMITTAGIADISTGAKIPEDGGWHHIACTFDYPNKKLITYVDGEVATEISDTQLSNWTVLFGPTPTTAADQNIVSAGQSLGQIGAEWNNNGTGDHTFTGCVDRLRLWKGVLTKDQLDYKHYDVYIPAEIVEDPSDIAVPGNLNGRDIPFTVTLEAKVAGSAPLTLQWFKDGEPIEGATSKALDVVVTDDVIGSSYYIEATNAAGTSRSKPAVISWATLTIGSKLVLDYQFTEGPGYYTTASSVGGVSAALGGVVYQGEYRPEEHYPTVSADSPSAQPGDNAVVFDGYGWLRGWTDQLYDLTKPFTMETWVYLDPESEKGYEGFATYGGSLKIGCTSDHYFVFTMCGVIDVKSPILVQTGYWQHLAAVWTPNVGVTFYQDGIDCGTISTLKNEETGEHYMPRAIRDADKKIVDGQEFYPITVGAETWGNPTQGMLDRVRVHQAVLTAEELDCWIEPGVYGATNPKPVRADTLFAFDFNKETEMPYSSTTTPVIVLDEDPSAETYESAAVKWSDLSPSGNDGDYSLYFDGGKRATMLSDYLQFDSNDPSFTIEAWVKGEPQSNRQVIFANYGSGGRFSFSIKSDYSVFATLYGVADISSNAKIPQDGLWHHIAFCYDFTDKMLLFYVDATLMDFASDYSGVIRFDNPGSTSYIGSESGGNYYKGNLDRLRVHTGVLDPKKLDYFNVDRTGLPSIVSVNIPEVVAGEKATFSVEATGSEPLTYQWFFNGNAIEGATSKEYTIEEAQLSDAGAYTVRVTNRKDSVTSVPQMMAVFSTPDSMVKLLDFQMDEGSGSTTTATVGEAVATLDPLNVIHSTDTPSGIMGDYSAEFDGRGFLRGDLGDLALVLDQGFTWESWVYRAEDDKGGANAEDFIRIGNSIKVGMNASKLFQGTFLGVADLNSNATLEAGVWYHLAVAWEPGVGVHFYVNGEDAGTVADTRNPRDFQNSLMTLAADNGGGCKFWGKLDRTRVHLGVLTADELDCEAANAKPATENTIFDYQFNEVLTDEDGAEYFDSVGQIDIAEYLYPKITSTMATVWTEGPYGVFNPETALVDSALEFAGSRAFFNTDGIDFGDTTDKSYSMEAWIKDVPEITNARQVFFSLPGNDAGTAPSISFSVGANHTIYCTAMGIVDHDTGVVIPTDSDWHHIAVAINMNAQLIYVYLDGQLADVHNYGWSVNMTYPSWWGSNLTGVGTLGSEVVFGTNPFYGIVDRVKLWKGVLSPMTMDYPPAAPLAPIPPVGDLELAYSIEDSDLVLRWEAASGASLEVAPAADSANWTILQGELVGGAYQCRVPMDSASAYYRLVK